MANFVLLFTLAVLVLSQTVDCFGKFPIFQHGNSGCTCDRKQALPAVSLPVNGGGNVLTRHQFNQFVTQRYWLGVYDVLGFNNQGNGHFYDYRQVYSPQLQNGNYDNTFWWQPQRFSNGPCSSTRSTIVPLNKKWAINNLIDVTTNRADALIEIYVSSCPTRYVWLFHCFDVNALNTGICPADKTLLILNVPDTNGSMDDLPWDSITRDLYANTQNTVSFCKQSNMESHYLLGANSCRPRPNKKYFH